MSKAGGCARPLLLALAAAVVLLGLIGLLYTGPAPRVSLQPALRGIGRRTPIRVRVEKPQRLERLRVEVVQGSDVKSVLEKAFEPAPLWKVWASGKPVEVTVEVGRETVQGLRSGEAVVRATAERAGWIFRQPAPVKAEITLPVRLTPPSVQVVSSLHYLAQGGSEAVVYRVGDGAVRHGVQSGTWWFPGFPMPGADRQLRFALFASPYDSGGAAQILLVAEDEVGNRAETAFVDKFTPRPLHTDTIQLDDAYLNRVVPQILSQSSELTDKGNPLDNYLQINRDLRRKNNLFLRQLAAKSAPKFLWSEPFLPLRNAKITAAFADRRTYVYKGMPVDEQDHLGFDMASVEHDVIPASNSGIVVLARYFGIFGNAVVIDHGYGLMSLYGHLSSIEVKEGDAVRRGQEIGRSGATGLAGGDHLHFTLLLQGLPVTPVEWWDPHWLQDRIERKLGEAFPKAPPS
jgi:murein DD-endopeptidase MepM/ murein hydrolase activator NlpD